MPIAAYRQNVRLRMQCCIAGCPNSGRIRAIGHINDSREETMAVAEQVQVYMQRLPAAAQAEVLNFVEYLVAKAEREAPQHEAQAWSEVSLTAALHGMEDEDAPEYTMSDLKVLF